MPYYVWRNLDRKPQLLGQLHKDARVIAGCTAYYSQHLQPKETMLPPLSITSKWAPLSLTAVSTTAAPWCRQTPMHTAGMTTNHQDHTTYVHNDTLRKQRNHAKPHLFTAIVTMHSSQINAPQRGRSHNCWQGKLCSVRSCTAASFHKPHKLADNTASAGKDLEG